MEIEDGVLHLHSSMVRLESCESNDINHPTLTNLHSSMVRLESVWLWAGLLTVIVFTFQYG